MLINTHASTSVYPCSRKPLATSPPRITTSTELVELGYAARAPMILLQLQRMRYTWDFEIAEVKKPILGADFLMAHILMVDLQRGCITSNEDQHLVLLYSLHVLSTSGDFFINHIHRLLKEEFRDVAGYESFQNPSTPPRTTPTTVVLQPSTHQCRVLVFNVRLGTPRHGRILGEVSVLRQGPETRHFQGPQTPHQLHHQVPLHIHLVPESRTPPPVYQSVYY